jgi:TonB family protein
VAIHLAVLIVVFQFRFSIEAQLNRYNVTTLYVPPAESVPAAVPKVRQASVLPTAPPPVLSPPALLAKLAPPPKPALDLPAPPELPVTRMAPLPAPHMLLPAPAPVPPLPASPVFASALPATPSTPHSVAPRTGPFGSVPAAPAPATAKPQIVGDTFGAVPADTPRHGSPTGAVLPAGFGAADVTAPNPHRGGPTVTSSNGFGRVAAAAPPAEPAPKATASAFTSAVAADPVRQPATKRQPAAEPLEILFKPRPDYTEDARRARLEGDVVLEVLFPSSGSPRVLRVVRGLGHGLDQNALDAAAKIRFRAATQDGRAVDTVAKVRISFQMAY